MTADDLALSSTTTVPGSETEKRRGPGPLRQMWWRACLKPYGDSLCTPGAAFWIFSARLAIFIMAAAEAVSWSYLGYTIGLSSQPIVTAALAGIAVFCVIWIIDASFITLDTSRASDEAALLGRETSGKSAKWKLAGGLLIRGFIICATLYLSAPFLAQLVFFRDISAEMARRDAATIASARGALASTFDSRVNGLLEMRRALDLASIQEAAGKGPSRQIGRGPAVATIERRLTDIDAQIASVQAEKERALGVFDSLDPKQLQSRFGLALSDDGIRARGEILGALTANATYGNAETAIRGFLAFLFLALLVLKLFQPASVSVYFSETLQDLNVQYRAGAFDAWLSPEERSYGRAPMTPLRFRNWCFENYRTIRNEDEQERRLSWMITKRKSREEELRNLRASARAECEGLRHEYDDAIRVSSKLEDSIQAAASELDAAHADLAAQNEARAAVTETMRSGLSGDAFVRAAEAHGAIESELASTRMRVRSHESEVDRLRRELQRQQTRTAEIAARLEARESVAQKIEAQLAQLTSETSAAIAGSTRVSATSA